MNFVGFDDMITQTRQLIGEVGPDEDLSVACHDACADVATWYTDEILAEVRGRFPGAKLDLTDPWQPSNGDRDLTWEDLAARLEAANNSEDREFWRWAQGCLIGEVLERELIKMIEDELTTQQA